MEAQLKTEPEFEETDMGSSAVKRKLSEIKWSDLTLLV